MWNSLESWLRFSKKIDILNEKVGILIYWLTLFMIFISAYNAITRYFGKFFGVNITSNALIELQWYCFSMIFLLGSAYALKHNAHVRVDILYNLWPETLKTYINILGTILFLLPFSLLILFTSLNSVINSWKILEMSPDPGGLPRYPIKTVVPCAFLLLILQGISYVIQNLAQLKKGYKIIEEKQIMEKRI